MGRHDDHRRLRRADPDQRVQDQYAAWHEKADGNCAIDYGFHQILGDVHDESLTAMDELIDEGVTSFKLFMAYKGVFYSDDGQILRALQKARRQRRADDDARRERHGIDVLVEQALAAATPRRSTTGSPGRGRPRRRPRTGRS